MSPIDLPAIGESTGRPRFESVANKSMKISSVRGSVYRGRMRKQPSLTVLSAHSGNHVVAERRTEKCEGRETQTCYPTVSNMSFVGGVSSNSPPSYKESIEDSGSYPSSCEVAPHTPSTLVSHYSPMEVSRTSTRPDSSLTATLRDCSGTSPAVSYNRFSAPLSAEGRSPTIREEWCRSTPGQWNVTMRLQIWHDGHKQAIPDCDDIEIELAYKEGWSMKGCGLSSTDARHVKAPWIRSAQNLLRSWFDGKSSSVPVPAEVTCGVVGQRSFLDMKGSRSSKIR